MVKRVTNYRLYILFVFVLFFAFMFGSTNMTAQDTTNNSKFSSFEGIHFLIGFMQNEYYIVNEQVGVDLKIFIGTKERTYIEIIFPDNTKLTGTVEKDTVISANISNSFYNTISEIVVKNAIEIKTDKPVVVYAFNSQERTSDSYSAIPISNWGKEYVVMSVPNDQYTLNTPPFDRADSLINYTPRTSEFLVLAAYDSTLITFKPKVLTEKGKQVYNYYTVKLNKGETYLVKSYETPMGTGDLTGTLITGNKPFGVLSGHERSAILQGLGENKDSKDHLAEMLMPVSSWGTTYISIPFGTSPYGDYFRVTCIKPQTNLKVYKTQFPESYGFTDSLSTLSFQNITTPVIWQADNPIQIAQFMQRNGSNQESKYYDPSMVMLPPREQFVQTLLFTVPGGTTNPRQYIVHYIALVAEESAISTLFLDGKKIDTITNISNQRLLNTNLFWCLISDTLFERNKSHKITSSTGKFSGIIFGLGEFDSYAMVLGSSLVDAELVDEMPPIIDVDIDCFTIKGKIYDFGALNVSGIDFAQVNEAETKNFQWTFDPIASDDSVITFTANVVDIYSDGKLVIDYWDKIGNKGTYTYDFSAVKLDYPNVLDFNIVKWTDSVCINFTISNKGQDSIVLQSIIYPSDPRVKFYFDNDIPNESVIGRICFKPNNTTYDLIDSLQLLFSCGIVKVIPIKAIITAPNIELTGWDFGNVYLQDTASGTISIKNTGNVPIFLDSLHYLMNNDQIQIETNNIFVYNLLPDSTLFLNVKFMPIVRGSVSDKIEFKNHLNLTNQLEIKGNGVAPDFSSYQIDFGKRRIGKNYDSLVGIKNAGNIASLLKFSNFNLKMGDDFNSAAISAINAIVGADSIYTLNLQYNPFDTSDYYLSANLICDWVLHPLIQIYITGKGSIPVINTYNVDFGTISYGNQKNLIPAIISNTGNEDLTIDSIFILSGDAQSFTIDYTALKNLKIAQKDSLSIPITFQPKNLKDNVLLLGVVNDAMPAYQRKLDTIIVRGFAVAPGNLDVDMELQSDMDFTSCQYDTIKVIFKNNEPFEVSLTKIEYTQTSADWQLEFLDNTISILPIELPAQSKYELTARVFFNANQSGNLTFTGYFNDSTIRTVQLLMEPKTNLLDIVDLNDITIPVDTTIKLTYSGKILSSTEVPTLLNFKLDYNRNVLFLLSDTASIKIKDINNNTTYYKLKITRSATGLDIKWDDAPRAFSKGENWEISFSFHSMLSNERYSDMVFSIMEPSCYNPNESSSNINIFEVCMNDLILITRDTTNSTFAISPNPVNNLLKIDFYLVKNAYIRIFVFDELGKEYILEENKYLQKGNNSLIYVVNNLTNGKYFLNVQIENKIETKTIILNR